jgi:hypothetical protein
MKEITSLHYVFMAETKEISGSQELRTMIASEKRTNHEFTRSEFITSVKHFGRVEFTDADVPPFDGVIFFTSEQYVAFIENLEKKSQMDEKKAIISEAVKKYTQAQTDILKASYEARKTEIQKSLEDLAPEKIESSFQTTERLIDLCPKGYETLLRGYAGSLILEKFENNGQRIVLKSDNKLEVNPIDQAHSTPELLQNNVDLTLRLNTLIEGKKMDTNILKTGMLYRAETFGSYSASIRDKDGKVMNLDKARDPNNYFQYLREQVHAEHKLSSAEQTLLDSQDSFRSLSPDMMISAVEQMKDFGQYKKRVEASMNSSVTLTPSGSTGPQSGNNIPTAAGEIGEVLGGGLGKIAGAGARGGMNVLTDMLNGATKEGGAMGALVVMGGLIAAVWKFGFWKTLAGIFGIGVLSEASAGRIDLKGEM